MENITSYRFGNSQTAIEYLADEAIVDNWLIKIAKVFALFIGLSLPVVFLFREEATPRRNEWVRRDEETPEEEAERKERTKKDRAEYLQQYFKDHPIHNN